MLSRISSTRIVPVGRLQFRFNWFIAACVVLTVSGLVRLGLWQLDRAEEKMQARNSAQLMQQEAAVPIETVPLAGLGIDMRQLQNQEVLLHGEYLNEQSIYLIYQTWQQQPGYEIVTPFKLTSSDEIVMVSRGWTGIASYEELNKKLPRIHGVQQVRGQIHVPTPGMMARSSDIKELKWPLLIRYLNIGELSPFFDTRLFPYPVRLNPDQAGVLIRHWPAVTADTGRNMSYALQWFAMAAAVVITTLLLSSNILNLLKNKASGP
ncbi:MAG: SURF1 family protein [Pseudomonadales bacterium]|nr:SURF1 family protein [Pseudomonadales bacterium]